MLIIAEKIYNIEAECDSVKESKLSQKREIDTKTRLTP